MTEVFSKLPQFSWRGKKYPVSQRSVSFAHESVQHKLQRRNQDLVEQTGAHNLILTYTIPMREGIFKGPYANLFTEGFPKLFADIRNKSPGELVDQFMGPLRCVPSSWNDESDVLKTDGTDIRVEFHAAPEDGDEEVFRFPTIQTVTSDGRELDVRMQGLAAGPANEAQEGALQAFKQIESEHGKTDILSAIAGVGQQIISAGERYNAGIDDLIFRAQKIEAVAEKLSNPDGWLIRDRSRTLRDSAMRAQAAVDRVVGTKNKRIKNAFSRSLASIAAAFGVSLSALLAANRHLARSPIVPPGAEVVIPNG